MNRQKTFPALTGLKGIFIFIIVLHHILPDTVFIHSIPMTSFITNFGGTLGNSMFFMISGFLMTLGYRDRIQSHTIDFGSYITRRLSRLYPLFLVTNLLAFLVSILNYGPSAINLKRIIFTLLLQAGAGMDHTFPYGGSSWFVSGLFTCYILFFLITYHAKHKTAYYSLVSLAVIVGYTLTSLNLSIPFCYHESGMAYKNFFIGCMLPEVFSCFTPKSRKWLDPAALLVLLFSFYLMLRYGVPVISGSFADALSFMLLPLLIFICSGNGFIPKLLATTPMVWLGNISISIFFWHMVIYDYYHYICGKFVDIQANQDLHFIICLTIIILLSILFHSIFKRKKWL